MKIAPELIAPIKKAKPPTRQPDGRYGCKEVGLWVIEQTAYNKEKDAHLKELRDQQCEFYKVLGCD